MDVYNLVLLCCSDSYKWKNKIKKKLKRKYLHVLGKYIHVLGKYSSPFFQSYEVIRDAIKSNKFDKI